MFIAGRYNYSRSKPYIFISHVSTYLFLPQPSHSKQKERNEKPVNTRHSNSIKYSNNARPRIAQKVPIKRYLGRVRKNHRLFGSSGKQKVYMRSRRIERLRHRVRLINRKISRHRLGTRCHTSYTRLSRLSWPGEAQEPPLQAHPTLVTEKVKETYT